MNGVYAANYRADYWGVLGTEARVNITARSRAQAVSAETALFTEVDRLCAVFNRFDTGSELHRWQRGEVAQPGGELLEVLTRAEYWHAVSASAFHPGAQALGAVWDEAERQGKLPEQATLDGVLAQLQAPLLGQDHTPPPYPINLNALAKGYIVDRAAAAAMQQEGVQSVQLNIGGDLCHLGAGECLAAISDPRSSAMNAAPQTTVRLSRAALASSGHAMRGRQVAGQWLSHLLDPRTGWPVNHGAEAVAGASVIAPTCLEADALSTILTVLDVDAGLLLCEAHGYAALLTLTGGQTRQSRRWNEYQSSPSLLGHLRARLTASFPNT